VHRGIGTSRQRPRATARSWSALTAVVVALAATLVLAGCVASKQTAAPTFTPIPTPTASASTAGAPAAPVLYPKGTAAQNLPYFDKVGHDLLDHDEGALGKQIVDYFVQAGFDKANMEVTPDKTSIGLAAWNIEFSVRMNGGCLIGQAGNVKFQSTVQPLLATGKCLIGLTRKIDW
jgi:hypothetical protein